MSSLLPKKSLRRPKIINFTDGSHGFAHPDGLYEIFVIDAKRKVHQEQDRQGEEDKERNIHHWRKDDCRFRQNCNWKAHSSKRVYRAMRRNECSNANFVKSKVILKLIVVKRNLQARTIVVIRIKVLKTRTPRHQKSVFFSKPSTPAAADPDSEDESYEPRACDPVKPSYFICPTSFLTTRFLDW